MIKTIGIRKKSTVFNHIQIPDIGPLEEYTSQTVLLSTFEVKMTGMEITEHMITKQSIIHPAFFLVIRNCFVKTLQTAPYLW